MDKLKIRTLVRKTIRALNVKDGDVILLKINTEGINDKKQVNAFANAIRAGGRPNCVLIALDNFDDLDVLNEEDMEKHGWIKKVKE